MNFLKILFNPIFLLAAGLHAGLLLIPVAGGSSEELVPAPDPEGESITVTRIAPQKKAKGADAKTASGQAPKAGNTNSSASKKGNSANSSQERRKKGRNTTEEINELPSPGNVVLVTPPGPPPITGSSSSSDNGQDNVVDTTDDSNTANQPSLPRELEQKDRQDLLAVLASRKEEGNLRDAPEILLNWFSRFRVRYGYSGKGTSEEDVKLAQENWLATLGEKGNLSLSEVPQPLDNSIKVEFPMLIEDEDGVGPTTFRRCLVPEPQDGLLGVVVDEEESIVGASTLLRSSGYRLLNELAFEAVKAYEDFPDENSHQAYTITVKVDYDKSTCISLEMLGIEPLKSEEPIEANSTSLKEPRNPLEEEADEPSAF